MAKIVTSCIYPPIPDRRCDWCAYYDGREEGDQGHGPTEQAAILDLIQNYDNPDSLDELADAVRKQGEELDRTLERLADN